jgi:hypothetical protein
MEHDSRCGRLKKGKADKTLDVEAVELCPGLWYNGVKERLGFLTAVASRKGIRGNRRWQTNWIVLQGALAKR